MPKSKVNKAREKKVNNFKNKIKQQQMNQSNIPQLPPVRNIPVWASDAKIEITGFEWEAIQNGLVQTQIMQQAAQSVMSRNIVNGVIKMDFEKLNPQTLQYEPMTEEEKAPHIEEFNKLIESVKSAANAPQANPEPMIVTPEGEPATAENVEKGAKIITLGSE